MTIEKTHNLKSKTSRSAAGTGAGRIAGLFVPCLVLLSCIMISDVYPAESQSAQYKEYEVKAAFMYNFLKFVDWPEEKTAKTGNQITIGIIGQDPFGAAADILKDKKVEERNVVLKRIDSLQQLKDAAEKDKAELTQKLKALTKNHIIYRDNDSKIIIKPEDEFGELKNITDAAARAAKIEELKKQGYFLADPSKTADIKTIVETIANEQMDALKKCHLLFICQSERKNTREIIDLLKNNGVLTVADTEGFLEDGGIVNFVIEDNKVRFDINLTASEKAGLKIRSQLLRLAKKVIKDGVEVTGPSETTRKEAK
ncbi:MAG: YfiR family protein [Sedimentisphaerales bacterium]|jgi:hypothetical protein